MCCKCIKNILKDYYESSAFGRDEFKKWTQIKHSHWFQQSQILIQILSRLGPVHITHSWARDRQSWSSSSHIWGNMTPASLLKVQNRHSQQLALSWLSSESPGWYYCSRKANFESTVYSRFRNSPPHQGSALEAVCYPVLQTAVHEPKFGNLPYRADQIWISKLRLQSHIQRDFFHKDS